MKFGGSGVVPLMRTSRAGRLELDWMQKWDVPVLVLNEGMTEEAVADGFPREQITWMPNPVDIEEFRPAREGESAAWRQRQGLPADATIVAYVGRLSHEKGLRELLRGFAQAARMNPQAFLLLIGDGPQRAELETLAKTLELLPYQIRFIGRVGIQEVPAWLRASDVFALISPSEGFSCALLEAMSVGLPSVVSDIPANCQLVDPEIHGLTPPFGNDDATGQAFTRMLSDSGMRERMGQAARQRVVANYSTDRVVDRYEALFAKLLD